MRVRLTRLTDEELHHLAELYNDLAGEQYSRGLQEFAADLADVIRVEQTDRRIAAAMDRDAVGHIWFGRL